jgi:hypothetical protein
LNGEVLLIMNEEDIKGTIEDEIEVPLAGTVIDGEWCGGSFYPADGSKPLLGAK